MRFASKSNTHVWCQRMSRLFCIEIPVEYQTPPQPIPNDMYLSRLDNKRITMIECAESSIKKMLDRESSMSFEKFASNRKHLIAPVTLINERGFIDHDFNLIKPIHYLNGKIRPIPNTFLLESDAEETPELLDSIKKRLRGARVDYHDLSDQIFSFRLYSVEKSYKGEKEMRGLIHRYFYPDDIQAFGREKVEEDEEEGHDFLEICAYNPRAHRLWFNLYSPNRHLDLQTPGIQAEPEWKYFAMRCLHGIPENLECFDRSPKEVNLTRLSLVNNPLNFKGKDILKKDKRNTKVSFAILAKERYETSGECLGFPLDMVDTGFVIPRNFEVTTSGGGHPITILRSEYNLCMVLIEEGTKERVFEQNGIFVHVFDPIGLWPEEQQRILDYIMADQGEGNNPGFPPQRPK